MTTLYTIPVVFHVVYHLEEENIAFRKIVGQVELLNKCFANQMDKSWVPDVFKARAADARIQFKLAVRDPSGRLTNGVTRTFTTTRLFSDKTDLVKSSASGGYDGWNSTQYMNVWVCHLIDTIYGYATYPYLSISAKHDPQDGVVVDYRTVSGEHDKNFWDARFGGKFGAQSKTLVHETGHYFNLKHLWGDGDKAHEGPGCGDDDVTDTPPQKGPNRYEVFAPSYPHISCGNTPDGDMFMNYMDYSSDDSLCMFTRGQVERMRACFQWSEQRKVLLSSDALTPPPGFGKAQNWTEGPFADPNAHLMRDSHYFVDINGDGTADALTHNLVGIFRLRLSTNGQFAPEMAVSSVEPLLFGDQSGKVYFANVAGDGYGTAILVCDDERILVRRWTGSEYGVLETWAQSSPARAGSETTVYFADVTGSGRDDAVFLTRGADDSEYFAFVMLSDGSQFGEPQDWTPVTLHAPQKAAYIADVDGDGRADLVLVDTASVRLCFSTGHRFSDPQVWSSRKHDFDTNADIRFADVLGDGRAHMILLKDERIHVRRSSGTGFSAPEDWTWQLPGFDDGAKIFFGSLSGGRFPDAVLVDRNVVRIRRFDGKQFGKVEPWTTIEIFDNVVWGPVPVALFGDEKSHLVWFSSYPEFPMMRINIRTFTTKNAFTDKFFNIMGDFTLGTRETHLAQLTLSPNADLVLLNEDSIKVRRYNHNERESFGPEEDWTWHDGPLYGTRGTFFARMGQGVDAAIVVDEDKIVIRQSDGERFRPAQTWSLPHEPLFPGRPTAFADIFYTGRAAAIYVDDHGAIARKARGNGYDDPLPLRYPGSSVRGELGTYFADVNGDGIAELIQVNQSGIVVRPVNAW